MDLNPKFPLYINASKDPSIYCILSSWIHRRTLKYLNILLENGVFVLVTSTEYVFVSFPDCRSVGHKTD